MVSIPVDSDSTESMNASERISEEMDDSLDLSETSQEMIREERLDLDQNNKGVVSIPGDSDSTGSMNASERISEETNDSLDLSEPSQEMITEEN